MSELLLHESGLSGMPGLGGAGQPLPGDQGNKYSSSSEEEEEEGEGEGEGGWMDTRQRNSAEESSDEEFTMKVMHMNAHMYNCIDHGT